MNALRDYMRAKSREAAARIVDDMKRDGVLEQFRNENGTYNGVKALAALSGLSEDEVKAMWERAKQRAEPVS